MTIQCSTSNGVCQLDVSDELTIYTAAQYKQEFLNYLSDSDELEVNLSEVSELDVAGLQILLLLNAEAAKQQKSLHFVKHSQPVIEVLELLNLTAHFGDPLVIPAGWQEQ